MSNKLNNRNLHAALLILMLLLFTVVFNRRWIGASNIAVAEHIDTNNADLKRAADAWNQSHAESAFRFARNGDLVLRAGSDAVSMLFRKANVRDKSYSHAGIIFIENGSPVVYNCIGSSDQPHKLLQRDSLLSYINPLNNGGFAIYRFNLSSKQVEKLHYIAVQYFKQGKRFDPNFDLTTDSLLYCTEFVYKALIETTGKKDYLPLTQVNDFSYVAVDNLYDRKDVKLICKIGYKQ